MSIEHAIFTGYANGDVHMAALQPQQNHSDAANEEMQGIGKLTNAGFRVVVASLWCNVDKKTASIDFAATWNENNVDIVLKHGDRVRTSHELYARWRLSPNKTLTSDELLHFCKLLKHPA